jgi:hypothetical protein
MHNKLTFLQVFCSSGQLNKNERALQRCYAMRIRTLSILIFASFEYVSPKLYLKYASVRDVTRFRVSQIARGRTVGLKITCIYFTVG